MKWVCVFKLETENIHGEEMVLILHVERGHLFPGYTAGFLQTYEEEFHLFYFLIIFSFLLSLFIPNCALITALLCLSYGYNFLTVFPTPHHSSTLQVLVRGLEFSNVVRNCFSLECLRPFIAMNTTLGSLNWDKSHALSAGQKIQSVS